MADPVTYERRGAAAILTIDREERRNAVDGPTADLLAAGFERFVGDPEARVLVLTGAGDIAFCAGADLKAIESLGPRIVGLGRGLDLILSGRIVDAEEAERIGLVTEVVPPRQHLERALEMAEALA